MRNFQSRLILLIVAIMAFAGNASKAQVLLPSDVEFRDPDGKIMTVIDPSGALSPEVKADISARLEDLRRESTAEIEVVIPPEIGDEEPQQWCEKLFTRMQLGKKDRDNGLLVMISPGSRKTFIMTGYGMEGTFTDMVCKKIINQSIIPAMRDGDIDKAVTDAVGSISAIATDPQYAEEFRSSQSEDDDLTLDPKVIWDFIRIVAGVVFLFALGMFGYDCWNSRRFKGNYAKAEMWRNHLFAYLISGILSLGAGLIFYLLAWFLYRSWRMRPLKCSTCGHRMKRLPEDKDNELLNDSQDFEENLKTVDYDVWECPSCGTVERFPFRSRQKKYSECPNCHTVAMSLDCDMIVRPATTRQAGEGVKIYDCKFCHHKQKKPYTIPKKEDPSAALAAGAVIGSAMGRDGNSGGGFGGGGFGGFGGGATGGGGAGGSW